VDRNLFRTKTSPPATDTVNAHGAPAYSIADARTKLAKLAAVGTLQPGFYVGQKEQLDDILKSATEVDDEFLAKAIVYAHERGGIKDAPIVLLAFLRRRNAVLFRIVADRVLRSSKSVKNFVRVVRSGVTGCKSLGHAGRKALCRWLDRQAADPIRLVRANVGGGKAGDPTLADVIRLARYRCRNDETLSVAPSESALDTIAERKNVFHWIMDRKGRPRPADLDLLDAFSAGKINHVPALDVRQFPSANQPLDAKRWAAVALTLTWGALRQELNALAERGVFMDHGATGIARTKEALAGATAAICERLSDPQLIRASRGMPYQVLSTLQALWPWEYVRGNVPDRFHIHEARRSIAMYSCPSSIMVALQRALDHTLGAVPKFPGKVRVALDVSGSMVKAWIGTSSVSAAMAGATLAAAICKANPDNSELITFSEKMTPVTVNQLDPTWTVVKSIPFMNSGTACGLAIRDLVDGWDGTTRKTVPAGSLPDFVVMISDNESWADMGDRDDKSACYRACGDRDSKKSQWPSRPLRELWVAYKRMNPRAKLIVIDLTPDTTIQVQPSDEILYVGGLNDSVFTLIADWIATGADMACAVERIDLYSNDHLTTGRESDPNPIG
jgi:60 kDa SS-A/Ro ribonucleoprotein